MIGTPMGEPISTTSPVSVAAYEALARERIDPAAWDFYSGGADDEVTLRDAVTAFRRLRLRPRILVDVSRCDTSAAAFGTMLPHPILVAPTAAHGYAHPEGEAETARGAAAGAALMTLSTVSTRTMEEVAAAAPDAPRWFQLYATGDREATRDLVERAMAAGYRAVAVTVDLPLPGNRERDLRNAFVVTRGAHAPETQPVDERGIIIPSPFDWDGLAWLRSVCRVPLLVKGILRADDALRAVDAGCDGVWVSNHGGRQLDTAVASIDALPDIADAVGDRALIVLDGGVRRGTDVLKALALGADLVAIGRPIIWGLGADGAAGVQRVIDILRNELRRDMALTGCRSVSEITRDLIA
jgi:isopentenyl diphosphate isomerase/L-lactate dehydrogenase-like FMN-dependent dehydrogenase